jgi:hypothetical protein
MAEVLPVDLTDDRRFELLKLELELIQGVFDKYDSMIFQSRNWFVTLWMATLGLAFTAHVPVLMLIAAGLSVLYWVLEGLMRHQYWYKYVIRYRSLRDEFNRTPPHVDAISIYDLTHHYGVPKPSEWERLLRSFGKLEPSVLYTSLGLGAIGVWWLVKVGTIRVSELVQ